MTHDGHPFWDGVEGRADPPPVSQLLGLRVLRCDVGSGEAEAEFHAGEELTTTGGRVQGGMVVAMLDEAMYAAACTLLETHEYSPTIDLNATFLSPAPAGRLVARSRVIRRGGSILFVEAEIFDPEGNLVARATASCRVLSTRHRPG